MINTETESDIVNILFSTIWTKITTGHAIRGTLISDNHYETKEHGPLYNNTLSKFISDKFGGDLKHGEDGSIITFEKKKFESYDEVYNYQTTGSNVKIKVELVNPIPEGTEGTDGSRDGRHYFGSENEDKGEYLSSKNKEKENTDPSPEPSEPSEPSVFLPPKCYQCDFSNYNTKGEYDYHCVTRHQGLPAYPGPYRYQGIKNLIPQGMSLGVYLGCFMFHS